MENSRGKVTEGVGMVRMEVRQRMSSRVSKKSSLGEGITVA